MAKTILIFSFLLSLHAQAQGFHPIDEDGSGAKSTKQEKSTSAAKSDAPDKKAKDEAPEASDTSIKEEKQALPGVTVSGVVRAVRGFPVTEVFFKDLKDSYFIDPTNSHDQIMNACLQSSRDGKSVSLRVDPVTHHVYSLSEQNKPNADQSSDSSKMSRGGSN